MRRLLLSISLAAAALAANALPASAKVVWRGDFVTGDFSQWGKVEAVAPDRLQIVGDDGGQAGLALRVAVQQGDDPIKASGNRNELSARSHEPEGSERWYRWQTFFPNEYVSADTWQLFTQFHHTGCCGSPPLEMYTRGEEMILRVDGNEVWKAPLERNKWRDFVLHVKWSPNGQQGFVEMSIDGQPALQRTPAKTMHAGEGIYMKQGLYRNKSIAHEQVLFHRGLVVGETQQDVMSPPPPDQTFSGT